MFNYLVSEIKTRREVSLEEAILIAREDIELMAEFGIVALQRGRLARIIEETYRQEAILDGSRLSVLFLEANRGLRQNLKHFWEQGVLLPVSGMCRENRRLMKDHRAVLALGRYLGGADPTQVRKSLAVSIRRSQRWWRDFKAVLQGRIGTPAARSDRRLAGIRGRIQPGT
ncbi:MAG: DUF1670 domain-containing protein [Bacillota bacterium]